MHICKTLMRMVQLTASAVEVGCVTAFKARLAAV